MWLREDGKFGQGGGRSSGAAGALRTVEALAFHGDIMKKSMEKAGFPVLGDWR